MSYTKRQLINDAYEELGLANYVYDLQAEQLQSALRRLEGMMAEWEDKMTLSYPFGSNIDEDTLLAENTTTAIVTNLAIRLAPTVGRVITPATKSAAKSSYATLYGAYSTIPQMQKRPVNSGAGQKPFDQYDNFLNGGDA